jgi:hypothetical protein
MYHKFLGYGLLDFICYDVCHYHWIGTEIDGQVINWYLYRWQNVLFLREELNMNWNDIVMTQYICKNILIVFYIN